MRAARSHPLRNEITGSRFVWGALGLCIVLLLVAVYVPVFARVMSLADPGAEGWLLVLLCSALTWVVGQGAKMLLARKTTAKTDS
jgi:Ca2+-transporting ATPase